jgi:hypothetical protein
MADHQQGDLITLEVAGRLLMISPERIRQLNKAGYIAIPKRGFTTIVSAVQGYVKFLKDSASEKTQNASENRVRDARAREIELRLARDTRDLIPQEEALLAMTMLTTFVAQQFQGLPARITRDMALRRTIEAELHGAQETIAAALGKLSGFVQDGGDPPETIAKGVS